MLPNLLHVRGNELLADVLSWPERSGCALQCVYKVSPIVSNGPTTIMTAEAVKRSCRGESVEIEIVKGWPGKPYYWGNRTVHEEEVEAAIHGMASHCELRLLSVPADRDIHEMPRAQILKSEDDTVVLFIANSLEEARILSGVVERLCDTSMLVQRTGEVDPPEGSLMASATYQRTGKKAPLVTRWLGGHGTRSQQAIELQIGSSWPVPARWSEK